MRIFISARRLLVIFFVVLVSIMLLVQPTHPPPPSPSFPITTQTTILSDMNGGRSTRLPASCARSRPLAVVGPNETFPFWGKLQSSSSPCPTAGMNNQLSMMMGLLMCVRRRGVRTFLWKDITCSPTGGKDGRSHYRVGADDYDYSWFRWSDVLNVNTSEVCLSDSHSWSQHGTWMRKCPTHTHGFYGTTEYWTLRRVFDFHSAYYRLAERMLREVFMVSGPYVAVHVRKGDYSNFCRDTAKGSGVKKYLIAPYVRGVGKGLGTNFMSQCDPSLSDVVKHVAAVAATIGTRNVFLSTNSAEVEKELSSAQHGLTIFTMPKKKVMFDEDDGESDRGVELVQSHRVVLSLILLARGEAKILNRYSTFSQTALDVATMHGFNTSVW
eukprot:PhM_4_TR2871/c0_g1_i2/m.96928/K03691/POFUT; peptide-O-fucosyltransferase